EHCEVTGVYANDAFLSAAKADPCDTAGTLKTALSGEDPNENPKIQRLNKYLNLSSAANIKILWPTEQVCQDQDLGDNDKSVVSLIGFAGRKILLCSDIEEFAQQQLRRLFPDLRANIVVAPHHGLGKSLQAKFLETLDADILICSCGQSQYERALDSVTRNPNKSKSFYTARDGAIIVRINKYGTIKTDVLVE
ncbi:MAG: hypothetical protein ACE5NM_14080, partial [Sedimentisphaerales bacterium]